MAWLNRKPWPAALTLAVGLIALAGCQQGETSSTAPAPQVAAPADPTTFPPLGQRRRVKPGVVLFEQTVGQGVTATHVGIYLPELPPEGKLPCVLIAPAGSRGVYGMNLSSGDQAEHVPYVRAGFAVVAYSLSGHVPDVRSDGQVTEGIRAFMQADGGLVNARTALDYALARVNKIDPERVYAAGHSSAGSLALLVAEHDPRIKACVAYAPVTDVPARLGPQTIDRVERQIAGFKEFAARISPRTHLDKLRCPVFLFHTRDDKNVPTSESVTFYNDLKKTNPKVKLVEPPAGGHYPAMLKQGIPQAIAWLKALAKA
jgi:dipeptidyl aminopeptidase/acylaminoacyl peptidase